MQVPTFEATCRALIGNTSFVNPPPSTSNDRQIFDIHYEEGECDGLHIVFKSVCFDEYYIFRSTFSCFLNNWRITSMSLYTEAIT